MSRAIVIGELVEGHFPVYKDDGYTKLPGLTNPDFITALFLDNAPSATIVTITEMPGAPGEYIYSWTPTAEGPYELVIRDPLFDIRGLEFESSPAGGGTTEQRLIEIQAQIDKIDRAPTLGPAAVTSGSLMDRMMNKDVSKTYNQGTDSLQALRDRSG